MSLLGEALLAPRITRRLIAEFTRQPEPARSLARQLDGVTEREREILAHLPFAAVVLRVRHKTAATAPPDQRIAPLAYAL